MKGCI